MVGAGIDVIFFGDTDFALNDDVVDPRTGFAGGYPSASDSPIASLGSPKSGGTFPASELRSIYS